MTLPGVLFPLDVAIPFFLEKGLHEAAKSRRGLLLRPSPTRSVLELRDRSPPVKETARPLLVPVRQLPAFWVLIDTVGGAESDGLGNATCE